MKQVHVVVGAILMLLCSAFSPAQQTVATATNAIVPPLVNFSGILTNVNGKPLTGMVGVTFYLYKDQHGGSPLWLETQNVQPDPTGHYSVMLGSTSSQGLPASIFTSGEAHWLGVQVQGQEEQPRVLLVSAPYALKAGDAETIGGMPPSAFVLAAPSSANAPGSSANAEPGAALGPSVFGSGTAGFVPLWTTTAMIGDSVLFQSGAGSTATVGINTATPAATLDVNGSLISRGPLQLPSTGTATAGAGFNSQPFSLQGSAFNSSTGKAIGPLFQWQTEPSGNDTSSPAGTLNLLYSTGSGSPTETGLNIASTGKITFATGQTFPGTGTVTSVGSGAGLTGGPITGSGTLSIGTAGVTNAMLANSSLTVAAGTDLIGGGSVALGGSTTLNVDTTKVAQLNSANTFVGNQAITGNLADSGNITATGSITGQTENLSATTNTGEVLNVTQSGSAYGINVTAPTGAAGVQAVAFDVGVSGTGTFTGGGGVGVLGSATSGYGVYGQDYATSGASTGVVGTTSSPQGEGVEGVNYGSGGVGVEGLELGLEGFGVEGMASGSDGYGGLFFGGPTATYRGSGLYARGGGDTTATGVGGGVGGAFSGGDSQNGFGGAGVFGQAGSGPVATFYPVAGVEGQTNGGGPGTFGHDSNLSGSAGFYFGNDYGVWGDASTGQAGVIGTSDNGFGVMAENNSSGTAAILAGNSNASSTAQAIRAGTNNGLAVIGSTGCSGTIGVQFGLGGMNSNCENYTLQGDGNGMTYLNASSSGKIAFRINNVTPSPMILNNNSTVTITSLDVTSSLTKPAGSFKIDHPLDPANKYLYHSFVESPDMKNIYDGVAVLDANGEAVVTLPDWFQALNRDFRYQLTSIGGFAPVYIAEEIQNNQFKIAGGKSGIKVSWQVTGIRQDAFANAHRIQVEVEKSVQDRGHYLHPELFGAPQTARIGYEPPMALAPAMQSNSVSAQRSVRPMRPMIRPRRPPLPVLPKLPAVKTPPQTPTNRAAK
jgi:hypothetical protein